MYTTSIDYLVSLCAQFGNTEGFGKYSFVFAYLAFFSIIAEVMGAFVYYFMNFNLIIVVLLAAVVYVVMLSALKTFSKEEIEMTKIIIRSMKHL